MPSEITVGEIISTNGTRLLIREVAGEEKERKLVEILGACKKANIPTYLVGSVAEIIGGTNKANTAKLARLAASYGEGGSEIDVDLFLQRDEADRDDLFMFERLRKEIPTDEVFGLPRTTPDRRDMKVWLGADETVLVEGKAMDAGDAEEVLSAMGFCPELAAGRLELEGGDIKYISVWSNEVDRYVPDPAEMVGGEKRGTLIKPLGALRLGVKAVLNNLLAGRDFDETKIVKILNRRLEAFRARGGYGDFRFDHYDFSPEEAYQGKGFPTTRWGLYILEKIVDCYVVDFEEAERVFDESGLGRLYGQGDDDQKAWMALESYLDKFCDSNKGRKLGDMAKVLRGRLFWASENK